nr:hypothetical protein [Tanacetum cinerariifolium]
MNPNYNHYDVCFQDDISKHTRTFQAYEQFQALGNHQAESSGPQKGHSYHTNERPDEELSDEGSPRAIVYGYDGLPMKLVALPSPDYVPGPEHPPSPDFVPGLEHPPSPIYVPYVPELEYPEYLVPSDAEAPLEDQSLPTDASPTALSPGYVADSNLDEDPKEELEEDNFDYPADGGDDDDDDTCDEDKEPFEDEEDDEEEEEHLAPTDSPVVLIIDLVPSAEDTEAFETDEAALTPVPSPRRHTARMSVRPQTHVPWPSEAEVERLLALPIPPPSPFTPLSSPLPQIPSPQLPPPPSSLHLPPPVPTSLPLPLSPLPPLPALLSIPSSVDRREDTSEAELPPRKRLCLTALTSRYEVGESSTAAPRPTGGHRADYGFIGMTDAESCYIITVTICHQKEPLLLQGLLLLRMAAPMTVAAVEQLIKARVSTALANHEALRNSTNGQGDGSHGSDTRMRGTVRTPPECTYKDFLNYKPHTFKGTEGVVVLSQWFEKMESVFQISNCDVENQVKFATCTFLGDKVEKYVGGLSDMIRGNVMSYQPKTMAKAIEFANDQMDQKNKRQNTGRAYTDGSGEKREYTGSLPLCTKCNYHHKGPCAPRCNKCKNISHLARDYKSSGPNNNNNNRGNSGMAQNDVTYYECGVQGYFKKDCPKLKNGNRGNQRGNGNALGKVYMVGNAGKNPDSNVVTEEVNVEEVNVDLKISLLKGDDVGTAHDKDSNESVAAKADGKHIGKPTRGLQYPNPSNLSNPSSGLDSTQGGSSNVTNLIIGSLVHEGDHVKVSSFAGKGSNLNVPNSSGIGVFTSHGELTNLSFSTMNPSKDYVEAGVNEFWSKSVNDLAVNVPTSTPFDFNTIWNSGGAISTCELAMVKTVDINAAPNSYAGSAGIPDLEGPKHTKETVRVEYKWKPPRCPTCNIFGHTEETCPKKVVSILAVNDNDTSDGFQQVRNKKRNNKGNSAGNRIPKGVLLSKGFQVGKDFAFNPKAPSNGNNGGGTRGEANSKAGSSTGTNKGASLAKRGTSNDRQHVKDVVDTGTMKMSNITSPNPSSALGEDEDAEKVKNIWDESVNLNLNTGASTPAHTVVNENNLSTCAILESHVDVAAIYDTCKKVNIRADNKALFYSFIYDDNYYVARRALWNNLAGHASLMRDKPWVLLGDFNDALNLEDRSYGGYEPNIAMQEFKECKIDRIMCNHPFNDDFLGSFSIFQPYRIFDHSPCVIRIPKVSRPKPNPFKFPNFLTYKYGFCNVVATGWNLNVHGCAMYRVVKRLKGLKTPLRKLLHDQRNLHDRVNRLRVELDEAHKAIDRNPSCSLLREEHAHYLLDFKEASLDKERDSANDLHEGNAVAAAFVSHYEQFLGLEGALFSMGDDKAPGPDGFTAAFFKKSWDIMGGEDTIAIRDFFSNDKLLKELNHTIISLILKVSTPAKINDYRLISCCNVLFKCISKIITNRIKGYLGDLRSPLRCAFKVDIQKAYDTVDWGFLRSILAGFRFHPTMVEWIMRRVQNAEDSQFHHLCEQQRIVNNCFADDLILFARGHPNYVRVIMDALEEFKIVSGFVPSILKSIAFFCNVTNALKVNILSSMPFAEGKMKKGKAKVAWEVVCLPQREGGLGIRRIEDFNIALMATHIWCILINKESLWVWFQVRPFTGMSSVPHSLVDVLAFLIQSKGSSVSNVISRIVLAAMTYCLWNERNSRLFNKKKSTADQLVQHITSLVRMKLVAFKFKKMTNGSRLLLDQ